MNIVAKKIPKNHASALEQFKKAERKRIFLKCQDLIHQAPVNIFINGTSGNLYIVKFKRFLSNKQQNLFSFF
jgi:hypothetical protein